MAFVRGLEKLGPSKWRIRVQARDPKTGAKIGAMETVTGTKAAAEARRAELHAELRDVGPKKARVRLRRYVSGWIAERESRLKPSVVYKYANNLDQHILPALGDHFVDAIQPSDVRRFIAERIASGLADNTVLNMLRLLRVIAKDAKADGLTDRDFCERVTAPTPVGYTEANPNLLNAEQLRDLLAAIPKQWRAIVMLIGYTGLRWGEASGLFWEDFNTRTMEISVRRGNWRGAEVTPKTRKSWRTVPLPPPVLALLRPRASGLVFPTRRGTAHRGTPLRAVLDKACKAAGVPRVTTHGLRRTFNNLARQVTTGEVLRAITGHATSAMTAHYSLIGRDEKAEASKAMRLLVEKNPDQSEQ